MRFPWFKSTSKRRRQRSAALQFEQLESRQLLSATIAGPTEVVVAHEVTFEFADNADGGANGDDGPLIETLIQDQRLTPVGVADTVKHAAIDDAGNTHVILGRGGSFNSSRLQLVSPVGDVAEVQPFVQLSGEAGGATVFRAVQLDDGRMLYLGDSTNGVISPSPTYWFDPTTPIIATTHIDRTGILVDSSTDGTIVGMYSDVAGIGEVDSGSDMQLLGLSGPALSITDDGSRVSGFSELWKAVESGWEPITTFDWEIPPTLFGLPTPWWRVEIDPQSGQPFYIGESTDVGTFLPTAAGWFEDGTSAFVAEPGETIIDVIEVGGHLVLGLDSPQGDRLVVLTDGSSVTVESLTGFPELTSLFDGGLGLAVENAAGDSFITIFDMAEQTADPDRTYDIDWNGDGLVDEQVIGPASGISVSHTFTELGPQTVYVTTEAGSTAELRVNVRSFRVTTEYGANVLRIGSSADGSRIRLRGDQLIIDGVQTSLTGLTVDRVIINGQAGDDRIILSPDSDVEVNAGDGNDVIRITGNGRRFLDGGDGDDRLIAVGGRNLLFGDDGNDRLRTNGAADILIGGLGLDRLIARGDRSLIITGDADSQLAEWDDALTELSRPAPDADVFRPLLADHVTIADGDRETLRVFSAAWGLIAEEDMIRGRDEALVIL